MIIAVLAYAGDVLIVGLAGVVAVIATTGGGEFSVVGLRVSATRVSNPTVVLALLTALRCWLLPARAVLGRAGMTPRAIGVRVARWGEVMLASQRPAAALTRGVLLALAVLSVGLRIVNASNPGFMTGDDVEINEMTFRALFALDWPIWNVRSPFYPFSFIYPAQAVAVHLGVTDPAAIVVAGRLAVVALTTASVFVVYLIARRLTGHGAMALLAAVLFGTSRLHLWFGGTEYPRPVAGLFILVAFYLLVSPSRSKTALAGALLGVGAAMRFGELLFLAPAAAQLIVLRKYRLAALTAACGAVAFAAVLTLSDWLYWGSPFFSVLNLAEYTFVRGQSSAGFQPWFFYFVSGTNWTNLPVLCLSLAAFRLADWRAGLWGWLPIVLLSLLSHKELRYAIPIQPFLILAATCAFHALLRPAPEGRRGTLAAVLVASMAFAVTIELGDWRIRKTDDAVRLAREMSASGVRGAALQQVWRFGGRLYLPDVPTIIELQEDVPQMLAEAAANPEVGAVVLLRSSLTADLERRLEVSGFSRRVAEGQYAVFRR